jgi:hypothetical protein
VFRGVIRRVIGKHPGHHQNCRHDPQDRCHHVDFPSSRHSACRGHPACPVM